MGWFNVRLVVLKRAIDRPAPKGILLAYAVIGVWDTLVSQFLPPTWAKELPSFYQILKMTSGFIPLWGWALVGMVLITGISIEYTFRKSQNTRSDTHALELSLYGKILTITLRKLFGLIGATRYALSFSWSSNGTGVFDEIEGHHPTIYHYDFDGDGVPEVIVRFHCGAHTHVMHVYKILNPPNSPSLISGADIGSDFPEITWKTRKNGKGVIIYANKRNWEGSSAAHTPIIERYIFENGQCIKLSHDRIIEE